MVRLLLRSGAKKWDPLTGDTRLRAYELIDANALVDSILVTDAPPNIKCDAIHTRLDFGRACRSDPGTPFWLRVGEQGLEWYEMAADLECGVTGQNFAEDAEHIIINYVMKQGSGFRFDRDWFCLCCRHCLSFALSWLSMERRVYRLSMGLPSSR